MSHTIRLRGPWEFAIAGTQIAGRIELPCDWSDLLSAVTSPGKPSFFLGAKAAITLRRHFHLPTGLEPGDRVLIVLRWQSPHATAQLNGTALELAEEADGSHQADVTGALSARNELAIDLEPLCPAPFHSRDPILEAALQIHPA
ncbi:MAG TPA: hypothetical protein VMP01_27930 [Pirellulaceae bacterium]|nr:hypothetical protein [Pirellulaceae bacterium]